MKKLLALITLASALLPANAKDRVIPFTELPKAAQQFVESNFKDKQLASAQIDTSMFGAITDGYKVVYTDGTEIEFDSSGNWEEIKTRIDAVPQNLIPEKITLYVKKHFKGLPIVEIKKENYGYEIKLSFGQELKFNSEYTFIGMD